MPNEESNEPQATPTPSRSVEVEPTRAPEVESERGTPIHPALYEEAE